MPLTQSQLTRAVAERAGLSRAQAKDAIQALEEVVLGEIGNAEKVKIGNLVQLTVRVKPATKERLGRNPATGEKVRVKKTSVPAFRPGQEFKDVVSGAKKLPKATAARSRTCCRARSTRDSRRRSASARPRARPRKRALCLSTRPISLEPKSAAAPRTSLCGSYPSSSRCPAIARAP